MGGVGGGGALRGDRERQREAGPPPQTPGRGGGKDGGEGAGLGNGQWQTGFPPRAPREVCARRHMGIWNRGASGRKHRAAMEGARLRRGEGCRALGWSGRVCVGAQAQVTPRMAGRAHGLYLAPQALAHPPTSFSASLAAGLWTMVTRPLLTTALVPASSSSASLEHHHQVEGEVGGVAEGGGQVGWGRRFAARGWWHDGAHMHHPTAAA